MWGGGWGRGITAAEHKKEKKRNEESLKDLWDTVKCTSIQIIGVPEEEKRPEKIFKEIMVENFLNMGKKIVTQVQEAQSPIQDKPKEKHCKTHINQTNNLNTKKKY